MLHIALPTHLYEEDQASMRRIARPGSAASGIMQTVPSDLPMTASSDESISHITDSGLLRK